MEINVSLKYYSSIGLSFFISNICTTVTLNLKICTQLPLLAPVPNNMNYNLSEDMKIYYEV